MNPERSSLYLKGAIGVAKACGVSVRMAESWIAGGRLPVKRLSKRLTLVKVTDLEAFIDREADLHQKGGR